MRSTATLFTALAAFGSVASAGYAQVSNKCSFDVFLWSVTPSTVGPEQTLVSSKGFYEEGYQALPTGGVSIKLSLYNSSAALYNGSALTQFQYTLDGATVWYDLADTMGDPFAPKAVTLSPSDSGCTAVNWAQGSGPSQVLNCGSGANLSLTVCA